MAQLPRVQGGDHRSDDFKQRGAESFEKTKEQRVEELGFTKKQGQRKYSRRTTQ
jgi:hypothetical protein